MNTVLYYPYITPRSDWLKMAALCWDKVYRIVPHNGVTNDTDAIRELDEALGGILEPVDIRPYGQTIAPQFWEWVEAREERLAQSEWSSDSYRERDAVFGIYTVKFHGEEFVEELNYRGLARVDHNNFRIVREEVGWGLARQTEEDNPDLYEEIEADRREYERLLEEARGAESRARHFEDRARMAGFELLRKRNEGFLLQAEEFRRKAEVLKAEAEQIRQENVVATYEQPIVYLPKDVALHYMSLCAVDAANDDGRDLVADGGKFTDAVLHDYEIRGEVGTAVLEAYLPENLSELDPERIKEFREEFSAQRLAYQTAVQEIVDQYASTASEGTLETVRKQIEDLARERVNETKKTYQRANQRMVINTLGMSLTPPAIATVIGSALGIGIFAPAGIAAAVSLFAAKVLLDRDEARSEMAKSPWSYVLSAAKL